MDLDLLVLGSGPSGQRAAIQAAKLGKRVAVVERRAKLGGNSIHTGTIPSKTLREAVLDELARRPLDIPDPIHAEHRERETLEFLLDRVAHVTGAEARLVREQFRRNNVGVLFGTGRFTDPHTICITDDDTVKSVTAENIVLAVGTTPARPPGVEFDDETIIDSDGLLRLDERLPRTMTVVGGGIIGIEYASMFGALGTKVTVVDQRDRLLPFLDGEIGEAFTYLLRRKNVTFRLNESVAAVRRPDEGNAIIELASGKHISAETVLYATGRQGSTDGIGLDLVGITADKRGRVEIDEEYRTKLPHVFAVGDVAGPPGLAATAMEQGRLAALHAFGRPATLLPELVPTGVYAIPEIGMVGSTEEQLTESAVPYVSGIARWSELARGLMSGDEDGMLKLLVSVEERRVLGVHVLGTGGSDLVHIGQAVMDRENGVDFRVSAVFKYPTFAESY